MGDRTRFSKFAALIRQHLPLEASIADVAGGKGTLQMALRQLGYRDVTSWDKRHRYARRRSIYRFGWFSWNEKTPYDAVVALHPDEGTDHALLYAARNGVPALICPCCILPSGESYWGPYKYPAWLTHLEQLALRHGASVERLKLPMSGRNDVLLINATARRS